MFVAPYREHYGKVVLFFQSLAQVDMLGLETDYLIPYE